MAVTITPVDIGTAPGDNTGDTPRVAFAATNSSDAALKVAVDALQGRFWTIQNTGTALALGSRYKANAHAGITFTLPAVFAQAADSLSDVWVTNMDDASDVTLTPASGDALFVSGVTLGVDVSRVLTPGQLAILSPRTTDSEWDVLVVGGAAGGAGDFKADGSVDMTGEFRTDVGTFDSDVANGASAVAWSYDTAVSYSSAGAKLANWKNNGTVKAFIDKDGYVGSARYGGAVATNSAFEFIGDGYRPKFNYAGVVRMVEFGNASLVLVNTGHLQWASGGISITDNATSVDTGIVRNAAGQLKITNGSTGTGKLIFIVPTSDPAIAGALWNNAGTLSISAG